MTLGEFFQFLQQHPFVLIGYFLVVPLTALLAGILGRGEAHLSPWNALYALLVYMTAVPGIFSLLLTVYLWLFERKSVLETDLMTQVLPVVSMVATLWLIRWNIPLRQVPGFGRLSGLLMMILVVLLLMWILDRTRLIAFTWIPFVWVIAILIGLLIVFRWGWAKWFEKS